LVAVDWLIHFADRHLTSPKASSGSFIFFLPWHNLHYT